MVHCNIFLESGGTAVFFPGQTIKGYAELVMDEPKSMRSLKILIHGDAYVYSDYTKNSHFINDEKYLNSETVVFGSPDGPTLELPAGTYRYNFECLLPEEIPASCQYENFHRCSKAYIRYYVELKMDLKWKIDQEFKLAFHVVRNEDLNLVPELALPCSVEESKQFCCLCCTSEPLMVEVSIPQTGYVGGQIIPIKVKYFNKSNVTIERTDVVLERYIEMYSSSEAILWQEQREYMRTAVAKDSAEGINPNSEAEIEINLKLPEDMESTCDRYCKILKKRYELQVIAAGPMLSRNCKVKIPIIIGKIPINPNQVQHEMKK